MTLDQSPGPRTVFRSGPCTAHVRRCQTRPADLQPSANPDTRFRPRCQQRVVTVHDAAERDSFGGPAIGYHQAGALPWDA